MAMRKKSGRDAYSTHDSINKAYEEGIQRGYDNVLEVKNDPSLLRYMRPTTRRKMAKMGIKMKKLS